MKCSIRVWCVHVSHVYMQCSILMFTCVSCVHEMQYKCLHVYMFLMCTWNAVYVSRLYMCRVCTWNAVYVSPCWHVSHVYMKCSISVSMCTCFSCVHEMQYTCLMCLWFSCKCVCFCTSCTVCVTCADRVQFVCVMCVLRGYYWCVRRVHVVQMLFVWASYVLFCCVRVTFLFHVVWKLFVCSVFLTCVPVVHSHT